jgi:glyoxylase-like metal-dependent hydrolase (beta-lactamase superfamily II)
MDGLRAVNIYVIDTGNGLTLVDGGWAIDESRRVLEASLKSIGFGLGEVTRVLVTHAHRDHYTLASVIGRDYGADISLGLGDKPSLDFIHSPESVGNLPNVQMLHEAGAGPLAARWASMDDVQAPDLSIWGYPDTWLEGDHALDVGARTLDAVHTPGHTQGHYVFADQAAGLLFAGDHVLPTITPSIGFESVPVQQPLRDFLGSLAKVRGLPDLAILPAHGPVAPSSHTRVDELTAHHEERLQLCLAALGDTTASAYEVAGELPWTRHQLDLTDLDIFNTALASLETKAHLELLVARGQAFRDKDEHGAVVFRV